VSLLAGVAHLFMLDGRETVSGGNACFVDSPAPQHSNRVGMQNVLRATRPPRHKETRMFTLDTCCTLVPYFEVQDGQLDAFKALGPQFVARTRTEPGCVHYAFSFNGNTAHCREGYVDAAAVLAHLQNVGELLGEALKIAKIVRLEVHAPAAEVEKLRGPMANLNPQFFVLEEGIRRSGGA
jgi:hypothetical protein